jgi:hypothetical protein
MFQPRRPVRPGVGPSVPREPPNLEGVPRYHDAEDVLALSGVEDLIPALDQSRIRCVD